ncbi:MAG: UDP-N-acetylmuramate--L-alanine ligase [Oscillospiraceae bacterium]|nr:UDP-N-acetylmuramate--L-alanine ligase [Oscillospiraceae bacterium]
MDHQNLLNEVKNIHFIGIGGSGICPLAEILLSKGYNITGSDVYNSDTLERVRSYGIKVFMGHKKENINGADLIVYSAAIKEQNEELVAAKNQGKIAIERSILLGLVTQKYKNFIAVCGTHGKTTTTSMLTQIFLKCGFDPTAIVGGHLPAIGGNSIVGKSDTVICEACEYVDTFLRLYPSVSVILNIEADHLDYFKNIQEIKRSFRKFALQTTQMLIINGDDKNVLAAASDVNLDVVSFGFDESNDCVAKNLKQKGAFSSFEVFCHEKKIADVSLKVPGKHNVYNALAAVCTAYKLGASKELISLAISEFSGVHRRFEILSKVNDITVVDDFAHHPTEIGVTLKAASQMGCARVIAVFQPHTYSRTYAFLNEFANALSLADKVILSEVLPVREKNEFGVSSGDLAKKIKGCVLLKTFEEIAEFVGKEAKAKDLIITLGGGNIYKCAELIVEKLRQRRD